MDIELINKCITLRKNLEGVHLLYENSEKNLNLRWNVILFDDNLVHNILLIITLFFLEILS
jgi:hypothetical protein